MWKYWPSYVKQFLSPYCVLALGQDSKGCLLKEAPDLREVTDGMGVALRMEGFVGQGKDLLLPQLLCTRM